MRLAYIGNFEPRYSTENEYLDAWQRAGHEVAPIQEGDVGDLFRLRKLIDERSIDLIQWTRTKYLAGRIDDAAWWEMLRMAGRRGIPVIGVHLDIWWGFNREKELATDPYFRGVDILFTADGGNQESWEQLGVEHRWLLPAISERWLGVGTPRDEYRSKIAFVGTWQGNYHKEAAHRHELVHWLQRNYGDDVRFYPKQGQHAIRGLELNDLYASVDVVVGDSAVLPGKSHYCSDRIPETMGRGGLLLHPWVEGVTSEFEHFWWEQGDWGRLKSEIERISTLPADEAAQRRECDRINIGAAHTYTHRVERIVETLEDDIGMIG